MSHEPPQTNPLPPDRPTEPHPDDIPLIRAAQIDLIDERPEYVAAQVAPRRTRLALILFVLTVGSTFFAGGSQFGGAPMRNPETGAIEVRLDWNAFIKNGLIYSISVLAILGAHEMGHYLQSRRYRVPASLPYFIPMPVSPLGTMGAVIVQGAGFADRKALFDIAISGPLAGLLIAIPVNWWGIAHTKIVQVAPHGVGYSNPLIVDWMVSIIHRPMAPNEDIALTPIVFAGWVGIFITGLNLIPIGQLDGGHILYTLLLRKSHLVARGLFFFALFMVLFGGMFFNAGYGSWGVMLFLIWMMGIRHPPTANDRVPLGWPRVLLGWATLAFIFVGFVPSPMYQAEPVQPRRPAPKPSPDDILVDQSPGRSLAAYSRVSR